LLHVRALILKAPNWYCSYKITGRLNARKNDVFFFAAFAVPLRLGEKSGLSH
jgi:hypothetical protein